jgi:hypothetical protein
LTFKSTIVVSPVGTYAENGAALLAAVDGIGGRTAETAMLVKIEPGFYDIGATTLSPPTYVALEGSGELTTIIYKTDPGTAAYGTVELGQETALSDVTVYAPPAQPTGSVAVITGFGTSTLARVHIVAPASATAGTNAIGLLNYYDAQTTLTDVDIDASAVGASSNATGIAAQTPGTVAQVHVHGGTINTSATGGAAGTAIYGDTSASVWVQNATLWGNVIEYGGQAFLFSSFVPNKTFVYNSGSIVCTGAYGFAQVYTGCP